MKRTKLTVADKLLFLKEVDDNPKMTRVDIAKKLGVSPSTLNAVVYKRKEIEEFAQQCGSNSMKKQRVRLGKFENLEKSLLEWYNEPRAANAVISGPLIIEKAKELALTLNLPDTFAASNGWLNNFKIRHGIRKRVCTESGLVIRDTLEHWIDTTLAHIVKTYETRDIFVAGETGLYYNMLPEKTRLRQGDTCSDGKSSKKRLTVLLCSNANGSMKLPALVIGKYKKPKCFNQKKTLPTQYAANKKAWITEKIFGDWLRSLDIKMGARKRKIVLFVNQCAAHSKEIFLKNIRIEFFPTNCSRVLHPLDLGLVQAFKQNYRKSILNRTFQYIVGTQEQRKVNEMQAITLIANAWLNVSSMTISKCFKKAGILPSAEKKIDEAMSEPEFPGWEYFELKKVTFQDYINIDSALVTTEPPEIEDAINENVIKVNSEDENVNGENVNGENVNGENKNGENVNGANVNGENVNGANINGENVNGVNVNGANVNGENIKEVENINEENVKEEKAGEKVQEENVGDVCVKVEEKEKEDTERNGDKNDSAKVKDNKVRSKESIKQDKFMEALSLMRISMCAWSEGKLNKDDKGLIVINELRTFRRR